MNRRVMKSVGSWYGSAVLLAGVMAALGAGSVRAFSLLSPPMLATNTVHTIALDNDLNGQINWLFNSGGTVVPPPNAQLLGLLDRVAQQWSMFGRAPIALRVNPAAQNFTNLNCTPTPNSCGVFDGSSTIRHGVRPSWMDPATLALATRWSTSDCDIFVPDGTPFALLEGGTDTNGAETGAGPSFSRNMGHELGHCLGLAHPEPQNINCMLGGAEAPLLCQTSMQRKWDHAAPDDVNGLRQQHGSHMSSINMVRSALGSTGATSWSTQPLVGNVSQFHVQPRVACHSGTTEIPDCVMAATSSDCPPGVQHCVRMVGVFQNGSQWNVSASTSLSGSSRQQVDVAYGRAANGAVAVRRDSADGRIRYSWWNLVSGAAVSEGFVTDAAGNPHITNFTPRVAWHEGIDRCIIFFADRTRTLWSAVSTSPECQNFLAARQVAFSDSIVRHPAGMFDVACPSHRKTPGSLVAGDACVLTMNEQTSGVATCPAGATCLNPLVPGPPAMDQILANQLTSCSFSMLQVGFNWTPNSVSCAFVGWQDVMQVGLWEARYGSPSSVQAWGTSVSRTFPFQSQNTANILHSNIGLAPPAQSIQIFDTPMGNATRTQWGGLSCDFVEFNQTMVCPQLIPVSGGVPW